ncbi:hypothetical protein EYB53_013700 [Candidatus Chloroploca sp. M-50]|uniref:Uncharacterized protein n=1 Tax=Candidatus Chloroploca mongolica TaxID=2528176 RepID=A0ABS4DBF8_9CHLR|nr:hypothetical protein [Candidatus Chloroploca mongolica]MBP1466764.1 hypothetical protein [Candidatus Chloroploca mongolica]
MASDKPERLVAHTAELEQLHERLDNLRRGAVPLRCLVNLCGVYGIGKRTLLAHLDQRTLLPDDVVKLRLALPILPPSARFVPLALKQALLDQIAACHPALTISPAPINDLNADAALTGLAGQLIEQSTCCLLLLDATVRGTPIAFNWLERGLLLPLVRTDHMIATIISRSPLRWREFDTRRRAEIMVLAPLSLEETALHLQLSIPEAEIIYGLTSGLPLANELALQMQAYLPVPSEWETGDKADLMGQILDALYQLVGPDLSPVLQCALEVLSVVREFSVPLMQRLIQHACGTTSETTRQTFLLLMVKQLQELDLVIWDQASLSYRVAPTLRRIIGTYVRYNNPERYEALRQLITDYYRQMLDEVLVSRHIHLVEFLWHLLDTPAPGEHRPANLLRGLVTRYLVSPDGRQIDDEEMSQLQMYLVTDPDLPAVLRRYGTHSQELVAMLEAQLSNDVAA